MSCGRYVSTGFGPVSSAVGMFEPVTTTRSTSAVDGGGAPGSAGTAGAGNCANAFDARINGNPTPAIKARRTNLNVFSAFCVISFSIGLRSEEHTSELQSHSDLVCRLLLEKKKQKRERAELVRNFGEHLCEQAWFDAQVHAF